MTAFKDLENSVIDRMRKELPAHLTYHCVEHTELVIERSEYIAQKEGLSKAKIKLIKTAALYHDFGFTKVYKDHEEKGVQIVKKELPAHGYTDKEIESICGMIMATKIPQRPNNDMENVIADADLEYLGSNDFERIGNRLYKELKHFNPKLKISEWNEIQIKFMSSHHYHTNYCKRYRQWRKNSNLESLK
ncbi:MAG: HD domain-containing protein [Bacteroidia bacterium]